VHDFQCTSSVTLCYDSYFRIVLNRQTVIKNILLTNQQSQKIYRFVQFIFG